MQLFQERLKDVFTFVLKLFNFSICFWEKKNTLLEITKIKNNKHSGLHAI